MITRSEIVIAECKRRGLTVDRVGKVWHIHGRGVDIRTLDLDSVHLSELAAHHPGPASTWR